MNAQGLRYVSATVSVCLFQEFQICFHLCLMGSNEYVLKPGVTELEIAETGCVIRTLSLLFECCSA